MGTAERTGMRHISEYVPREREQRTDDPYAGGTWTHQGWFSREDLAAAQARVITVNGQRVVQFPIRYEEDGPVYAPTGTENAGKRRAMAEADAAKSKAKHEGRR